MLAEILLIVFYVLMLKWYNAKPKKRKLIKVIYGIVALYLLLAIHPNVESFIQSIFDFDLVEWSNIIATLITLVGMYFGGFWGLDKYANR